MIFLSLINNFNMPMDQRDPQTYAIIGAAMEVHRELGGGFLEAVYHEAMALELKIRNIPFLREAPLPISCKGNMLGSSYRADFLCFNSVIVELKALVNPSGREEAQIIHYLKASGHIRALLLNFGLSSLDARRIVLSPNDSRSSLPNLR